MRLLHIGVFTEDPDPARLPEHWRSDGDSFLAWGERDDVYPSPIHLTTGPWNHPVRARAVESLRFALAQHLRSGERLTDYAVETDADDWNKDVRVFLLDGTSHRADADDTGLTY